MKIKPNYSKQHICHFCKKNIADFECGTSTHLHYRSGFMSFKLKKATVEVPRCKKCKIKHTISYLPGAIVALIIYAWWIMFGLIGILKELFVFDFPEAVIVIILIIMLFIVSTNLAWLSLLLSHYIFAFVLRVKYNLPFVVDNYEPIRKLKEIGFTHVFISERNNPYTQTTPFTEENFSDRLNSIVEKDNCIVYDGNFVYGD